MIKGKLLCDNCSNMEICKAYNTIKKFDPDRCKNPFPVDIVIDNCEKYVQNADEPNTSYEEY